jgi:hypothetical protein
MTEQRSYHTHTHNYHQLKSSKPANIKKYNRARDTYTASDTEPICENKGNDHKKVWEPNCEEHKKVWDPKCEGHKKVWDPKCEGHKKVWDPKCEGHKKVWDPKCEGHKKVWDPKCEGHKKVWDPKCEGHKLCETTSTNDINEHSKWMKVCDCSILIDPPNPSDMSILFKGGCYISNQNADTSKTCIKHIKEQIHDNKLLLSLNTPEQKPVSNNYAVQLPAGLHTELPAGLHTELPAGLHTERSGRLLPELPDDAFGTLKM